MHKLIGKLPPDLRKRIVRSRVRFDADGAGGVTFRVAADEREVEAAHRLVHDCYVASGLMDPCPTGMRRTRYHDNPGAAVLVAVARGKVIATGSIYPDRGSGLPSDELLSDTLDDLRRQGRVLVEVGNLATHPDYRKGDQTLPLHLNKLICQYGMHAARADDLIIAVNPKHFWVYEDILLFERLSGTLDYGYVKNNPAIVARLDLDTVARRMADVYPHKPLHRNAHYFFFIHEHANVHVPVAQPTGRGRPLAAPSQAAHSDPRTATQGAARSGYALS